VPNGTSGNAAGDGEDAAWHDLVARFDAPEPADGATPWPDREDLAGPVRVTPTPPPVKPPMMPPAMPPVLPDALPREPSGGLPEKPATPGSTTQGPPWPPVSAGPAPKGTAAPDDTADDHYVPPPPPPLPKLDPITKGAWVALFGGPLYLLIATAVGGGVSGLAAFLSVAAFVGGFAILVLRMDNGGPRDSGPDDGAVV